jgi:C-terminal processing protease CtpA/Prc
LSLAKRMGYDGVYIRSIGPENSLAFQEGTLRVGDRIMRVQNIELGKDETPLTVVKQLKEIVGPLKIHVKRRQ